MAEISLEFTPRPQQEEIFSFVKDAIANRKKFMMVDAPTGVGKSYAAIMIAEWYRKTHSKAKIDIVTNTKLLQDQYTKDFNFIATLKGKNNYHCSKHDTNCGVGAALNTLTKNSCKSCQYMIAKSNYARSPLSLTNFHLLTSYSMYAQEFLADRGSQLLIIDESHSFEEIYCGFISSVFSERSLKQLDIWKDYMEVDLDKLSSLDEISEYIKNVIVPVLANKISELNKTALTIRTKAKRLDFIKKSELLDEIMCKYNRFVEDKDNYSTNWIFEKDLDTYGKVRILVEPIWGNIYLNEQFWKKYDHIILMSGTILNKELFSFIMGIPEEESEYLSLPCPFEAKNRPVIYLKFGKMSYYHKRQTFEKAAPILTKILNKNIKHKGIIHTSTYEFSKWIGELVKNKRLLIHDFKNREQMLTKHLVSTNETVLVSPSMFNGIDLKDELSRFQIILKVPFPNLTSTKIKKRLASKPEWYNWKALTDLLQAYGRSIRNENDWAETYILDSCFDQILENKNMPKYFLDALKIKQPSN